MLICSIVWCCFVYIYIILIFQLRIPSSSHSSRLIQTSCIESNLVHTTPPRQATNRGSRPRGGGRISGLIDCPGALCCNCDRTLIEKESQSERVSRGVYVHVRTYRQRSASPKPSTAPPPPKIKIDPARLLTRSGVAASREHATATSSGIFAASCTMSKPGSGGGGMGCGIATCVVVTSPVSGLVVVTSSKTGSGGGGGGGRRCSVALDIHLVWTAETLAIRFKCCTRELLTTSSSRISVM